MIDKIPGLKIEPFPYQYKGVAFFEHKRGRGLLADEQGLGKTIQTAAWLQLHPELRPVVIVCPSSVKYVWEHELQRCLEHGDVQVLEGTKAQWPITEQIVIVNYDILHAWLERLQATGPRVLVLDEVQYIANQSRRTRAVKTLAKGIPHVIELSGTPIRNRPIELYNGLKLLIPNLMSRWHYAFRYCNPKHNGFGWNFNGSSNVEELHKLVGGVMLRRLKRDVLPDLPPKIRSTLPVRIDNWPEYQLAELDFAAWVRENKGVTTAKRVTAIAKVEALKQITVRGKIAQTVEWIKNFLSGGGKLGVFAIHKSTIAVLMAEFGPVAVKIDGSVTGLNRNKVVEQFQHDNKIRLFVGNIQAAGIGITLTTGATVLFIELPWAPADLDQAEDRFHRISQTQTVYVYHLIAAGTIEERIARLLDSKRGVVDAVVDGKAPEEGSLLTELLKSYEEENHESQNQKQIH